MSSPTEPPEPITVFQADSIIQRDAILAALKFEGIACSSPPRDVSRQLTADTMDLAFEGFSALKKDTFPIRVSPFHAERVQKIIEQVLSESNQHPVFMRSPLQRFRGACVFSVVFPILFHGIAIYNLVQYFQTFPREKFLTWKTLGALLIGLVTLAGFLILAWIYFGPHVHR